MKFTPMTVTDRLGREVVLRNAEVSDAAALLEYLKVTAMETPFLIREPEEITMTLEQEEAFLKAKVEDEQELMLIATVDGKQVGNCSLMSMGSFQRYHHRCDIAIALYQEYCGAGIGRILLTKVLEVAKACGYEQAELEVIAKNTGAISLYETLGFEKVGQFKHNVKYKDGSYDDAYYMIKML